MTRKTYWQEEKGIWYFYMNCPEERYVLDFDSSLIQKQYSILDEWNDGNPFALLSFPATLEEAKELVEIDFKNEEIASKEWEAEMWNEIIAEESERLKERDSWKKKLKGLINTKRLWEDMSEYDSWNIEGIVEVELTDKKKSSYQDYPCAYIKEKQDYLFMKQKPDYGVKYINHYYVWQTIGYLGDDYSGYVLYPLKDGKYLKISYSC